MIKKRLVGVIAILPLVLTLCPIKFVLAESITLKTGKKIQGKVIGGTGEYIKVDVYGALFTYRVDDIERIEGIENKVFESDLNNDGRPDMWESFNDKWKSTLRAGDLNSDGKVDATVKFDYEKGMEITERDTNFDGKIDVWAEMPIESILTSQKEGFIKQDTNFDGKVDKCIYSKGTSARIEYDTNFDGKIDSWEYREGGKLIKKELDTDFDGIPDKVN